MAINRNSSGQSLVEWAILLPLWVLRTVAIVAFGEYFVIRHQLLAVVRQGALLYSSGRITSEETRQRMRRALLEQYPHLDVPLSSIQVGRSHDSEAFRFQLDEIKIRYRPTTLMRYFMRGPLEERCVIKHAPPYRQALFPLINSGPPVTW
jgi:hypothetical protein